MPLPSKKFLQYVLATAIALIVAGLFAFYLFLNKQERTIAENDAARGIYAEGGRVPSFEGAAGDRIKNTVSGAGANEGKEGDAGAEKTTPRLWQAARSPVAGFGFAEGLSVRQAGAASSGIYFAERSSGYIFAADPKTGGVSRLSNRLFLKTYEAFFDNNGGVILRSVNEDGAAITFSGTIATSTLSGKYLENGIRALSMNPKTGELFYLKNGSSGETVGVVSMKDGARQKIAFSSLLSNWRPAFLPDGRLFVVLKASDDASGYAYEVRDGALLPLARDIPGLIFLPKTDSSAALFSASQSGAVQLYARVGATTIELPLKTAADKCVWSSASAADSKDLIAYCAVPQIIPSKNFIGDRYRGAAHTSDDWWRVKASEGAVEFLFSPEAGVDIDVENPVMDNENETIAFMNALDKTLWVLRVAEKAD